MDRLLTMNDLQFAPTGFPHNELVGTAEIYAPGDLVKFRVRCADGKRGIITTLSNLHGTPEENAQNIANLCNLPCQWVTSDQRAVWSTCTPLRLKEGKTMDRLLTVDDLKPMYLGEAYSSISPVREAYLDAFLADTAGDNGGVVVIDEDHSYNLVKFRILNFRGHRKVGIIARVDELHGTPEENARNIAKTAGVGCEWSARDFLTCEPGD